MQHRNDIDNYSSASEYTARYNNQEDIWNNLIKYAAKDSIDLRNLSASDKDFLQKRIKAQLARYKWRTEGYYEAMNSFDSAIKKAMEETVKIKKQSANGALLK